MIHVIREVFLGEHPESITIRPAPEHASMIEICAVSDDAKAYWGEISIILTPSEVRELAQAMTDTAGDMERQGKK